MPRAMLLVACAVCVRQTVVGISSGQVNVVRSERHLRRHMNVYIKTEV